jgi:hypothetical protein
MTCETTKKTRSSKRIGTIQQRRNLRKNIILQICIATGKNYSDFLSRSDRPISIENKAIINSIRQMIKELRN